MAYNRDEIKVDRRKLIKGGAIATGAAWAAPVVASSFATNAWAAGTTITTPTTPSNDPTPVTIPNNRAVNYTIIGGGGGGGLFNSENGGSGVQVTGQIAASSTGYTLNVWLGGGGKQAPTRVSKNVADGGLGYSQGGKGGGVQGSDLTGNRGGGGGGASAIVSTAGPTVKIVAAGGGGAGGGGDKSDPGAGGPGHTESPTFSYSVTSGHAGDDGSDGLFSDYPGSGGKGGTTTAGGAAGASNKGSDTTGTNATAGGANGGIGGSTATTWCGDGGGGGGGVYGGGGGGYGGSDGNAPSAPTKPGAPSGTDTNNYGGGGAGGTGSSIATGPTGTTGTATLADPRAIDSTTVGTMAGHCGNGRRWSGDSTPWSTSGVSDGGDGSIVMTLA